MCLKAMAKEPGERYANMNALAVALSDYLRAPGQSSSARLEHPAEKVFAEFAAQAKLTSIQTRPSLSGARPRRFPTWAWIALSVCALLLLSAVVLYVATDYGTLQIELSDPAANVAGLHVFTFNELERTERWRRRLPLSASRR